MAAPRLIVSACMAALLLCSLQAFARAEISDRGEWPATWPVELQPLRDVSTTMIFMSAVHEKIYEIPIRNRQQFESLWPVILSLKSPGAPLRLSEPRIAWDGSNEHATVRIFAPTDNLVVVRNQEELQAMEETPEQVAAKDPAADAMLAGPPWPETALSEDGELPEYVRADVVDGKRTWVPADKDFRGFRTRARIEIELVVDGSIVDLNRIALPENTPIIDRRAPALDTKANHETPPPKSE